MNIPCRVLIIGGGVTGTGLARDLALRGVASFTVEKRDLAAGASGGNHGLLHSGARYVGSDPEAAEECASENELLKKLAPHTIEDTGGLFVAVEGDDEKYVADFPSLCRKRGVEAREITPIEAREREPAISPKAIAAYRVRDASIDPFMLTLDNMAQAVSLGASVRRNARVTRFHILKNRIVRVELMDDTRGEPFTVTPELVVNASGAWAGLITGLAGIELKLLYSSGTLAVTQDRMAHAVINRLRPASDADILVPGGTVSILGTTSVRIDHPDLCRPSAGEVDQMIDDAREMVPELDRVRYIRAYSGVRPLVGSGGSGDDRDVSRGLALLDHEADGVDNFVTITGGKLTTFRLLAEKSADLVCAKLGVDAPCATRTTPLPSSAMGRWAEPAVAARSWARERTPGEVVLCECELVSSRVVDEIMEALGDLRGRSALKGISLRSRVGKGPCQGAFCGPRVTSHLYDTGRLKGDKGLVELRLFLERRWRGKAPVLWGSSLMQAELQEALHCSLLELEP